MQRFKAKFKDKEPMNASEVAYEVNCNDCTKNIHIQWKLETY